LDIFPRDQLIYLSKDAKQPIREFNPNKTYIIGSIIDSNNSKDHFATYSQAKMDNIPSYRLPLDENVKYIRLLQIYSLFFPQSNNNQILKDGYKDKKI
jgi:hypothetical protein